MVHWLTNTLLVVSSERLLHPELTLHQLIALPNDLNRPAGSVENKESRDFVVRIGSRAEVDARFKGLMTTLSTVITPERAQRLGKRIAIE